MAQRIQFGVVLSGDHRGAVRSTRVTRRELKQLRGEVDKTGRAARDTNARFQRWGKTMTTLRGAMGPLVGIAGVGIMGRFAQQAIASTAAIQDQADTAGIGAERFQELTKAWSDMAGVAESVSAGGLRRFNRRLGLARQGSTAQIEAFDRLNVQLSQDTPAALETTIRKLAEIENAQDRAAAASLVFGEDAGPQIAAALGKGQKALEQTIIGLRDAGRIMDEETTKAATELNRRFETLSDTLTTRFRSAVVSSAGWLDDLGEAFARMQVGHDGSIPEINAEIERLEGNLQRLSETRGPQRDTLQRTVGSPDEIRSRINALEELRATLDGLEDGDSGDSDTGELSSRLKLLNDIDAKWRQMGQSQAGLVRGGNPLEAFGPGSSRQTSFGGGVVGRSSQSPAGGPMLMAEGFRRLSEDADKAGESVDRVRESGEELNGLGADLNLTFSSAFEDAIVEGRELREVMQGLLQDLTRLVIRKSVTEPAGNAIAKAFAEAFSFSGTSAGTHPAESADGNLFTKPGLTTIAERGEPEAVLPLERRGGKLGVRASGVDRSSGDTYVIDARGADAGQLTRLEQTIRSLHGSIERRSVEAVVQDALRGGRTKRAMG